MNEGARVAHEMDVGFVELSSFSLKQACLNFHARRTQVCEASAGDEWIRVFDGSDDASNARAYQRFCARRRPPEMRVWLKRDVCGCPPRLLTRLFKRNRLGMAYLFVNVKTFADHITSRRDNHTAD
jgi:hypothetical protein